MKKENLQAETAHVAVDAQLANGKSVVDHNLFYNTLDDAYVETKRLVLYSAFKKAGFKVVFITGNRLIDYRHITQLYKSLDASKRFKQECLVVPLKPILERYNIKVEDIDGNPVTIDSPDVDKAVIVYDGQHRIAVCELHPETDVCLALNDFDGSHPLSTIKLINSFNKNWDCSDLRQSNVEAGISTNLLYSESKKIQNLFGITQKYSDYVLTFKREACKKSDLVAGKDTVTYNPANAKRGEEILNALMMKFECCKEAKKIELWDAVVNTYDSLSDNDKPLFSRLMKLVIYSLTDSQLDKIKNLIGTKDFGEVKTVLCKAYNSFSKSEEELAELEAQADADIAAFVEALQKKNEEKAASKPLKSGTIHELISHNTALAKKQEQEKLMKAKEKLEKAQKKAQEAQAVVDHLKQSDEAQEEEVEAQ